MGVKAVESLLEGRSNEMIGIRDTSLVLVPIAEAISGLTQVDQELIRVSDIMTT
jgi:6-phosphofructokinase 1